MLRSIRTGAKSAVTGGLAGLLILSLAFGFGGGYLGGAGGGYAARIGDRDVSPTELARAAQNELRALQRRAGEPITGDQARALGLGEEALRRLVAQTAAENATQALRLTASDEVLRETIRREPAFRGALGGGFDANAYRRALAQANLEPADFEELVRDDLVRAQLLDAAASAAAPTPEWIAKALLRHERQRRAAVYVLVQPDMAPAPPEPTDEDLKEFVNRNPSAFRAPERRQGDVVIFDPNAMAEAVDISDESLREAFDAARDTFGEPERRTVVFLAFGDDRDRARQAAADLKAGDSAEALAARYGFGPQEVLWETARMDDLPDEAAARAVFALQEGESAGPIVGDLGVFAARVDEVFPGEDVSLDDVRDEIRRDLALEQAADAAYYAADAFDAAIAEGGTFEDALQAARDAANLFAGEIATANVDAMGRDEDGAPVEPFGRPIADILFALEPGEVSALEDVGEDAFMVARLAEVITARTPPLDEIRDEAARRWTRAERQKSIAEEAQTIKADAERLGGLEVATEERGVAPIAVPDGVPRSGPVEAFSETFVARLFASEAGTVLTGPARFGESHVVAEAGALLEPAIDPDAQAEFLARLSDVARAEAADALVGEAQKIQGVKINRTVVDTVLDQAL